MACNTSHKDHEILMQRVSCHGSVHNDRIPKLMHRSIAGYFPYNLFIITIDYSKNFTTRWLLTIGHMSMFVVKSIVIQIISLAYGSINIDIEPPMSNTFK